MLRVEFQAELRDGAAYWKNVEKCQIAPGRKMQVEFSLSKKIHFLEHQNS